MLTIFTIVLDGMPFMRWHLPILDRLSIKWRWIIVEGAAMPRGSTKWCRPQAPRLSRDGTTEFLTQISNHPRVKVIRQQTWNSKDDMVNAALAAVTEPCILLQMDADELWTTNQLETMYDLFRNPHNQRYNSAYFYCTYYLGPNIVITSNDTYGNKPGEWLRAWRFQPHMRFEKHEPPVLRGFVPVPFLRDMTADAGLIFQHFAYCFPEQVYFKERFYGYPNALMQWQSLQRNTKWPTRVRDWLPWVKDDAMANLLHT